MIEYFYQNWIPGPKLTLLIRSKELGILDWEHVASLFLSLSFSNTDASSNVIYSYLDVWH